MVLENPFVILIDFETTGKYPDKDRIVQFGAKLLRCQNKPNNEFNHYVNPNIPINFRSKAESIHKIEAASLLQKKSFPAIFELFQNYIKFHISDLTNCQIVLCAHNGFGFDFKLLIYEMIRYNVYFDPSFEIYLCDSLHVYKEWWPGLNTYRLGEIHKNKLNFPIDNAHDALGDVCAMRRLFAFRVKENVTNINTNNVSNADTIETTNNVSNADTIETTNNVSNADNTTNTEYIVEKDMFQTICPKLFEEEFQFYKKIIESKNIDIKPESKYVYIMYRYNDEYSKKLIKEDGGKWDAMRKTYYYPSEEHFQKARVQTRIIPS